MLSSVYLAAEDEPGLAVGRKLIAEASPLSIYFEKIGHGFGQLRSRTPSFQRMAEQGFPVLMLTDLDDDPCPSGKIDAWLGNTPTQGFLFRICVREVEAWLLAHRDAMASFLGLKLSQIPASPETLDDPKKALIALAQRSRQRMIRIGFQPIGSATIGPEYNNLLKHFIRDSWEAAVASEAAPSLARARKRIFQLSVSVIG